MLTKRRDTKPWCAAAVGVFFDTGNETAADGYGGVGYAAEQVVFNAPRSFSRGSEFHSVISATSTLVRRSTTTTLISNFLIRWNGAGRSSRGWARRRRLRLATSGRTADVLLKEQQLSIKLQNPTFADGVTTLGNGSTLKLQLPAGKVPEDGNARSTGSGLLYLVAFIGL